MRQYVKTERAHFMCPNMHFGILFEIPKAYNENRIIETCEILSNAHPFLRATMAYEENTDCLFYNVTAQSQIQIIFREAFSMKDYDDIDESEWDIFESGLLKVFCYHNETGTTILFVVHHLLADGKGAMALAQEFADYYAGNVLPKETEEHLISNMSELPAGCGLKGINKCLINFLNKKWLKENKKLTYEAYLELVRKYNKTHEVKYDMAKIPTEKFNKIKNLCRENQVTVNDVLLAQMFFEEECQKIIMAVDIREKVKTYNTGALGNYASAFSIESNSKTTQLEVKAKEIHNLVKKKMENTNSLMAILACYFLLEPLLLDAAAMAGIGLYDSKTAAFVGKTILGYASPSAFSITNLGKIINDNLVYAAFIPPASPATRKTLGVVTVNDQMIISSSTNVTA